MEVQFNDARYDRLETDPGYTHGLPASVVSSYRMCLQLLRATAGEQDLRALRILDLVSITENPTACHSVPLSEGYEIVLELRSGVANRHAHIIEVTKSIHPGSEK
jgi:plasmid maintenance system killer protein